MPPIAMHSAEAEALAIQVLGWIAGEEERLVRFLGMTGASVEDLRAQAAQPAFLGSVLDFLLSEDAAVIACCEELGIAPEEPMRARASLPGGDLPHWT
ncbi:MAG: DUF3572 domain-containing protein [Pseudomonadota bacterium]